MPEEVEDCVQSVMDDGHDESSAWAICQAQNKGSDDPEAVAAMVLKLQDDEWPGIHPAEKTSSGRSHLRETHMEQAKEIIDSATETTKFKASLHAENRTVFKVADGDDDRFIIWGKASVEVVDKEGDKITAEALKKALPQLLRRKRLSFKHRDQLVGDILESFDVDDPVSVEIDGKEYTRSEFPTDVLQLDGEDPALYVAGEVWDDTQMAREVREKIEDGEIDSYSISGETVTSSTQVKDGSVYDEITELDLSAVTLCEEGMNQKAKFGTVVKRIGDDSGNPESNSPLTILKHDTMSESETEEKDGEMLTREDLQAEFKDAAQDALKEANFATVDDVNSIVNEKLEEVGVVEADEKGDDYEEDEEMPEDDEDKAEDLPEDDEPAEDEMADVPGEDEAEDDEKAEDAVRQAAEVVSDAYPEVDAEDVADSIEGMVEGADGDEEVVPEGGGDGEEMKGVMAQLEDQGVPDDLIDAVSEYVDDDPAEVEEVGEDDEVVEMEDDEDDEMEDETEKSTDTDPDDDIAKVDMSEMSDSEYLESTVTGPLPSIEEPEPAFEKADTEGEVEESGDTAALAAFYDSQNEDFTNE